MVAENIPTFIAIFHKYISFVLPAGQYLSEEIGQDLKLLIR